MLHKDVSVENVVPAITLMQEALCEFQPKIIPDVYAWNSPADGNGWIVEEFMGGQPLSGKVFELPQSQKEIVLVDMVHIFKRTQSYKLPLIGTGLGDSPLMTMAR
jgi:hypothetical protein